MEDQGLGSWWQRAQAATGRDIAAYQQGGVPAIVGGLAAGDQERQDLLGGFGVAGITKAGGPMANALAETVLARPPGIRAYHGSPYDFDRFDLSKIGSGEGNQVYGHGLYFAENPAVATGYKAAGQPSYLGADRISAAQQLLKDAGGDRAGALSLAQARMSATTKYGEGKLWQDVINNFDHLVGTGPGKMYEVNLNASPEQFINWDQPLAQQPPQVGTALGNVVDQTYKPGFYKDFSTAGADFKDVVQHLDNIDPADLSQALARASVPGVRYLDAGSRSAGVGSRTMTGERPTSNYVVFNPGIIDIMKKYALPLGVGVGAGALGANQQQTQ